MKHLTEETKRQAIITALYPIPDPLHSLEEHRRFTHKDLDAMTEDELIREYECVKWCLLFDHHPHHWLVQCKELLSALIHAAKQRD